jgi:dihydrofolate reductase
VTETPELILISAMTRDRVIGRDHALPWSIPEEYEHFLSHVRGNTVLMGRTSYEIFGPDLQDTRMIVVSRALAAAKGAEVCGDIPSAVARALSYGKPVYSSGGATIYEQTLPYADAMYLSFVKEEHEGDTFFPAWDDEAWEVTEREDRGSYEFRIYRRRQKTPGC